VPDDFGRHYIGGRWIAAGGEPLRVVDKYDGRELATIALAGGDEMATAIAAACDARPRLRSASAGERAGWLAALTDGLAREREAFALLLQQEAGKPISLARAEVDRGLATLGAAAAEATRFAGEVIPIDFGVGAGRSAFTKRVPVGVVAAITPFNFPLNLVLHKLGPALAVGCPLVLKPAPQAPLCALALARLAEAAKLPAGAFQVVLGDVAAAESLVRDERVALLSFTGSARVGWHLKSIVGRKKVVLELGGNAAAIVDESADLELAARKIATSAYAYAGQSCISTQRIFVHTTVADRLQELLLAQITALRCGDPAEKDVVVGPIIDGGHFDRVSQWVAEAVARGAHTLAGGKPFDADHHVLAPTLLSNVDPSARVCCEEVFGPVAVLRVVPDFSTALACANDSAYGLQAGVFTNDLAHMRLAHEQLEVGAVIVNDASSFRIDTMPYGGVKRSGLGREGVRAAMEDMTEGRMVVY
jgi:glyceraldehyde-3-phosphate dehydrogenase (NADP+)